MGGLPLYWVVVSQFVQFLGIAAAIFFLQETFNKKVFPDGSRLDEAALSGQFQRWWGAGAFWSVGLNMFATSLFASPPAQRKVLQYTLGAYLVIATFLLYEGDYHGNRFVLIWAGLNSGLLLLAAYVWHAEEKDTFYADPKLKNAARIFYLLLSGVALFEISNYSFLSLKDTAAAENADNAYQMRLAGILRVFPILSIVAAAQVGDADLKKIVQFQMLAVATNSFGKVALSGVELKSSCCVIIVLASTIAAINANVWLTYGGSCHKSYIRLAYTMELTFGFIGFMNPDLFKQLVYPTRLDTPVEAVMNTAALRVFIGFAYIAGAQFEAADQKKLLQYSIPGDLFHFGALLYAGADQYNTYLPLAYAIITTLVVYPEQTGLKRFPCPVSWFSCWANTASTGRSRSPSPRSSARSASPKRGGAGRHSTPGRKSKSASSAGKKKAN